MAGLRRRHRRHWQQRQAGRAPRFRSRQPGRIARITGVAAGDDHRHRPSSTVYRYDRQGRLVLVRDLAAADDGTPYGYDPQGRLLTDTLTADLGTP